MSTSSTSIQPGSPLAVPEVLLLFLFILCETSGPDRYHEYGHSENTEFPELTSPEQSQYR